MKDSFAELIKLDTLKAAVNYVLDDRKDDFVPDSVGHQDFFYNLDDYLLGLSERLKYGLYRPHPLLEIDVPKSGLAVRPGSVLHFEDRVVMFAIARVLAPRLDKLLPKNVFHYRTKQGKKLKKELFEKNKPVLLSKKERRAIRTFTDWYEAWPAFISEAVASYEEEGFEFLVEADVASYFENINHELLRELLTSKLGAHLKVINLLFKILGEWSQSSLYGFQPGRGIPQGNEVSSWLGTLYLIELDKEMIKIKHPIKYLRYVDDIMVFTKDRPIAREVVQRINYTLRRLHLNMQTSKLNIVEKHQFESQLGTEELALITELVNSIGKLGRQELDKRATIRQQLVGLYEKHFSHPKSFGKLRLRIFKRLLTGFMLLRDNYLVDKIWPILLEYPVITEKALRYLSIFRGDINIPHQLLEIIKTSEELSDWQLASFIGVLGHFDNVPSETPAIIKKLARRMDRHWAVRMQSHKLLLVLPWSLPADQRWCQRVHKREVHPQVSKIILLHVFRCQGAFRHAFMAQTIYDDDPETTRFRKFLYALLHQPDLARKQITYLMTGVLRFDDYLYILYILLESKNDDVLERLVKLVNVKMKDYNKGNITNRLTEIRDQANTVLTKRALTKSARP